jgi:hypothetical protein
MLRTMRDYRYHSWLLVMDAWVAIRSYSAEAAEILRTAAEQARGQLYSETCTLPYEAFFYAVPASHLTFFDGLLTHYRSADCYCSHAGVDPAVDIDAQTRYALLNGAADFPAGYRGSELVVYGHWNNAVVDQQNWPHPQVVGQTVGLDSSGHGIVTAMRFPDRHVFQSSRYATMMK